MQNDLQFNPAFAGLQPSSTIFINETVNQRWRRGETVYHMGFGESRFDVHPKLNAALSENATKKSYLPARGLPELTEAVANYYSHKLRKHSAGHDERKCEFKSDQVIIGPGSKSIIYGLQMVLNADVFLPTPSWVSYGPQATILGRNFKYIESKVENDYALEIAELDKQIRQSNNPCKLLILNSPNNPTGQVLTEDFLQELADYCRAHDIWVLSDEIYFQVCHEGQTHFSIAQFYPERTFVLGGLSKHLSIGGWRLGVGLLPDSDQGREIMKHLTVLASETWSGVASPIQYAAIKAYELDPDIEQYVADCSAIHGARTRFFNQCLTEMGVRCTRAQGGFYIMPNFDSFTSGLKKLGVTTSSELAKYLLREHAIATLPGKDFGTPEKTQSLRLSTSYLDLETEFDAGRLLGLYHSAVDVKTLMSEQNHPNMHRAIDEFRNFVSSISLG